MAMSKLQEWLQNKKYSFLKYRFESQLRTAYRRHLAFQVFVTVCHAIISLVIIPLVHSLWSIFCVPPIKYAMFWVKRWSAFHEIRLVVVQEKLMDEIESSGPSLEKVAEFKTLCKLRGIITDDVEETNELGETKLMAAAAEGW
jgi:hypothetical protein